MTISEIQAEIIEEFALFDDLEDKYTYLIDLGAKLPNLPEDFRLPERRIHGCASNVWLAATLDGGKIYYQADTDREAKIARGMVSVLLRVLSGHTPQEIVSADVSFIHEIGLGQFLTMQRSNGFASMVKQMKLNAVTLSAQDATPIQ